MQRYFLAVMAIVIAVFTVAFTQPEKTSSNLQNHYYRFDGPDPLDISDYTELDNSGGTTAEQKYTALGCDEGSEMCGIVSSIANPTLEDSETSPDGFPDEVGDVLQSDQQP